MDPWHCPCGATNSSERCATCAYEPSQRVRQLTAMFTLYPPICALYPEPISVTN